MKCMTHDRVRKFLRRFSNTEDLKNFCNKHTKLLKNRLPQHVLSAVRRKSNSHYTERATVLLNTVAR